VTGRERGRALLAFALLLGTAVSCGKSGGSATALALSGGDDTAGPAHPEPMDAREADLWAHAKDGDDEDRMRLFDRIGCTGLRERAEDPQLRPTAIRAMAYCSDFSELPWLAGVGSSSTDASALDALQTVVDLAARPRRATDPEDAAELGEGCRTLLSFARQASGPRARRVVAIRGLRMLADRGCLKPGDIPNDLDAVAKSPAP
jgi:hypothetical protein